MRLGVHVSIAGGVLNALERAKRLSCNTMQIFSRSPRGGPARPFSEEELREFDHRRRQADIEPLAVHCPYIINVASPDQVIFRNSVRLYREDYLRCRQLGARYLVTHVGSHRGGGEEAGVARVADALNQTLDDAEGRSGQAGTTLLLENTAGAGQGLGFTFEHLAAIRGRVRRQDAVGVCLDTAHLFAAGFAIHTAEGLEQTLRAFNRIVGLEHLKLIHLNDSKAAFDARVDRHWHIGEGRIGLDAMRRIVTHPRLRTIPMILETPKKTDEDDPRNLAVVRSFLGAGAPATARKAS